MTSNPHAPTLPHPQTSPAGAADDAWDMIIEPKGRLFDLHLQDLWRYRDLILLFVRRDFVARYKQTVFGPTWFFINPIMTTLIFTVVFGNIAKLSTDGLPKILFYLSGTVMWGYFAGTLTATANTFRGNAHLFGKVYFPRLAVPIGVLISNLISFGLRFLMFFAVLDFYMLKGVWIGPNPHMALLPVLILIMAVFGLGTGIIISSATTKYRDLSFMLAFGINLLMYATPVIYPLSMMPSQKYRLLIMANPMTALLEAFRYGFLGSGSFSWGMLGYSAAVSFALLFVGILIFNQIERTFMDTV